MNDRCAGAGELPQLDLSFRHHAVRGTWLDRRVFRWPYTVSRGFRLDPASPDMLTLIVQTMSGAIQADDRLVQRIHVGRRAAAHVTGQGATPVYRAPSGMSANDDIALEVEDGGCIEYMPDLRILFPDASLTQRIRVQLPANATAILRRWLRYARPGWRGSAVSPLSLEPATATAGRHPARHGSART